MSKKSNNLTWISDLCSENFLSIYDVVLDIEKGQQMMEGNVVIIRLLPVKVKFQQLMPADGTNFRDRYCELRWKAAGFLKEKGILESVEFVEGLHRWEERLKIAINKPVFSSVMEALRKEYGRRISSDKKEKSKEEAAFLTKKEGPVGKIRSLCLRFHSIVIQLKRRHQDRPTLNVNDEYDVQDILHVLLLLYFNDIRPEAWTPDYAGGASKVDFLLRPEKIVIETKKTREGLSARKIGDQLIIDIARYSEMNDCEKLICLVYDPENRIANPGGLENDLSGKKENIEVEVIIIPKLLPPFFCICLRRTMRKFRLFSVHTFLYRISGIGQGRKAVNRTSDARFIPIHSVPSPCCNALLSGCWFPKKV